MPPTLTITGQPTVTEEATYTLNLSASEKGDHSIDHWTINWGDGTLRLQTVDGNPPSVTHVYASGPNLYTINATATDDVGHVQAASDKVIVSVKHAPPTLAISGSSTVVEGTVYTLQLSGSEVGSHTIKSIGSSIAGATARHGPRSWWSNPTSVTHTFIGQTLPHDFTISAKATDDVGTYVATRHGGGRCAARGADPQHHRPVKCHGGAALHAESVRHRVVAGAHHPALDHQLGRRHSRHRGQGQPGVGQAHLRFHGEQGHHQRPTATDDIGTYDAGNTLNVVVS